MSLHCLPNIHHVAVGAIFRCIRLSGEMERNGDSASLIPGRPPSLMETRPQSTSQRQNNPAPGIQLPSAQYQRNNSSLQNHRNPTKHNPRRRRRHSPSPNTSARNTNRRRARHPHYRSRPCRGCRRRRSTNSQPNTTRRIRSPFRRDRRTANLIAILHDLEQLRCRAARMAETRDGAVLDDGGVGGGALAIEVCCAAGRVGQGGGVAREGARGKVEGRCVCDRGDERD